MSVAQKLLRVKPLQMAGPDYVLVCGHFEGGSASATTKLSGQGWKISTGAGSGVYTIVFDAEYTIANLISVVYSIGGETISEVDYFGVYTDHNGSTASSLLFTTSTDETGTPTPTDLAANQYCYFQAVFSVSGLAIPGRSLVS